MPQWSNYFVVFFLVALLAGCATGDRPAGQESPLTALTAEVTAAANTLADAADAGLIRRDSDAYKAIKQALETVWTYLELAWSYHADGKVIDGNLARQQALSAYGPIRGAIVRLRDELEEGK
jgi:hypothetical protein